MKLRNLILCAFISFSLCSCKKENNSENNQVEQHYTITWLNYDGSILEIDENVDQGTLPTYDGKTPTRLSNEQYSYSFTGWSPKITSVTADKTYIAQYNQLVNSYTITWDIEGNKTIETYNYGETPSYKNGVPTKEGNNQYKYIFNGWSPSITTVTCDKTYNAQFSALLEKAYVSFDLNGGTTQSDSDGRYLSSLDSDYFFFDVKKDNFDFLGWEYQGIRIFDYLGNKVNEVPLAEQMTFKAVFGTLYTIHFETNGGNPIDDLVAEKDDPISVNPSRDGYSFIGWYTDSSCSLSSYFELGNTMPAFNGTLYAKWSLIFYTISYHLDARTTNNPSNPTSYNILSETITLLAPTVSHGTFNGWYTDSEFKNEIKKITKGTTGNIDLYAKETATIYTITFVTNGGDFISPIKGTYGDSVVIPTPKKDNSVFVGWFMDESLTQNAYIFTMPDEDITLYAKWAKMYTVFEMNSKQYMYFGTYPQSIVSDANIINELSKITAVNSRGYYEYNGDEYAKQDVHAYYFSYTYSNGSEVKSGSTEYFKVEPILWRVLTSDSSGNYTLLADQTINAHQYDYSSNNYANSEIRGWINNDFFNIAFKTSEKGAILTTTVDNSPSTTDSNTNPYACGNTSDKVFLLSYKDYINPAYGFSSSYSSYDSLRKCKPTDYALANYCCAYAASGSHDWNCAYWTRSPLSDGINSRNAWYVICGYLDYHGYVDTDYNGVRPALNINL